MIPLESRELVPVSPYLWRTRNPGQVSRLICFPHAGAGAAAFTEWAGLLPPEIELVAVQLPGRQNRITEEPFTESGPLLGALTHALRPVLDQPFVFFGHSCGAELAYELAKTLRSRGRRQPEHLFLSARAAPDAPRLPDLHTLPDAEFRAELLALGGIDAEIAADEDVVAALLPLLRVDFGLWERHRPTPAPPLDVPITVLRGTADPRATEVAVRGWAAHTVARCTTRTYPGGHFYHLDSTADVVSFIARTTLTHARNRRSA